MKKSLIAVSLFTCLLTVGCGSTAPTAEKSKAQTGPKLFMSNSLQDAPLYSVNKQTASGVKKPSFGVVNEDVEPLPAGAGVWLSVDTTKGPSFDWKMNLPMGEQTLLRTGTDKFAKGIVFVINNTNDALSGKLPFTFEYKLKDADPATKDVFSMLSFKVWGVPTEQWDGLLNLSAGDGEWAASGASDGKKIPGAVELAQRAKLPLADDWKEISVQADLTGMKWIFVTYGHAFREDVVNPDALQDLVAIRKVMVPSP